MRGTDTLYDTLRYGTDAFSRQARRERLAGALALLIAMALCVGAGYLLPAQTVPIAVLAAAAMVLCAGLVDPSVVALAGLPALFVLSRVGAGGPDMAMSDAYLFLMVPPCLIAAARPFARELSVLLWLSALYQAAIALSVVARLDPSNPEYYGLFEWFHEWALVAGALLVGWVLGRHGRCIPAMRVVMGMGWLLGASVLATFLVNAASGDFRPVYPRYPYEMHKNFAGTVLAITAVIGYIRPDWAGISARWGRLTFWVLTLMTVLTQSRQALVGIAAAVLLVLYRERGRARRSQLVVLAVIPLMVFVTLMVRDQIRSGDRFNSFNQRIDWFGHSMDVLSSDWLFGGGLRWWYTGRFPVNFQPPNAELEVATSAGLIGLAAFLVMMGGTFRVLFRMDTVYGTLPLAVMTVRFVQGQMDGYWIAVQASLPYVVIGIAIGAMALRDSAVEVKVPLHVMAQGVSRPSA